MHIALRRLGWAIIVAFGCLGTFLFLASTGGDLSAVAAQGAKRYVAPDGSDTSNDCAAAGAPCATLQHAIDEAAVDDEIAVAAGVYTDVHRRYGLTQIAYVSKCVTLRGGYSSDFSNRDPGTYVTTLDAGGLGRVLVITGPITPTVTGFYITGGDATGLGGGVFGDDDAGGGVYIHGADALIHDNVIADNEATNGSVGFFGSLGVGGGLYATGGAPVVVGNVVLDNQAIAATGFFDFGQGGGMAFVESEPVIDANDVRNNRAVGSGTMGEAGGILLEDCAAFTLTNNIIAENTGGDYGGNGISVAFGPAGRGWMAHNTVAYNLDDSDGPGVFVGAGLQDTASHLTMINTLVAGHTTGVMVGGNMAAKVTTILTRTLWWDNATNLELVTDPPTHTLRSTAAFTGNPQFLSPSTGDYHIAASSAAVDAGYDAGIITDVDGETRDAAPDIGADEAGDTAIQMAKVADTQEVYPGDTVGYTITLHAAGNDDVLDVVLTDTLPYALRPLDAGGDQKPCSILDPGYGGVVACAVGNLMAGEQVVITVTGQVTTTEPAAPPVSLRNLAIADGEGGHAAAGADVTWRATPTCSARVGGLLPTYPTVQAAVDAAGPGDTVWIAGTCVGADARGGLSQQAYVTKPLTLRGGYNADFTVRDPVAYPTTLDAQGLGRVVVVTGTQDVVLEALRLTGGDASGLGGVFDMDAGGGVLAVSAGVTLSRCEVFSNVASTLFSGLGGGLAATTSTLSLRDTQVVSNAGSDAAFGMGEGGGLFAASSAVRVDGSRFGGNVASSGGLLAGLGGGTTLYESALAANATFWISNTTSSNFDWGQGGGLFVMGARPFTLTNCILMGNRAWDDAGGSGSALFVDGAEGVLRHSTLVRNGDHEAIHTTFSSTLAITNAVVVSQPIGILAVGNSDVTVNGVLWHQVSTPTLAITATLTVSHPVSGDPAFAADGYHLTADSAARDAGVASCVTTDIDGATRPQGKKADLGADEYAEGNTIFLPLVLR